MLEEILMEVNNWFVQPGGVHTGTYSIKDSGIVLPFLVDGQYFRIVGSIFNDGLHQYPASDLTDEEFTGAVWALTIPPSVKEFAAEVEEWKKKHPPTIVTSENFFGEYSYNNGTNANGAPLGWRDVFQDRLNGWRRIGGLHP